MNKVLKTCLIIICSILVIACLIYMGFFHNSIKKNDPTTLGNTAGNLLNGGLFCEADGKVYFSNGYDNGSLYVLNPQTDEMTRLNSNNCYSINVAGDHLYFCMLSAGNNGPGLGSVVKNSGVYRSTLQGRRTKCLNTSACVAMQLYGNDLYYQQTTATGTISIKQAINKLDKLTIADFLMNPVSIDSGTIYYNGTVEDHYLYGMDTISGNISLLWDENVWNPIYSGGYIYYISLDGKYNLYRYSLGTREKELLSKNRVDCFNVYGDIIYYAVSAGKNPALHRIHTDGNGEELVAEGIYNHINITSDYVYFTPYDNPSPIYRQSTYGGVHVTEFTQAASAALQNSIG